MAATASSNFSAAFPPFSSLSKVKAFGSISFFRPNSTPKSFRLKNPPKRSRVPKQVFCVPVVSCLGDNHSEASSELGPSHVTGDAEEVYDAVGNNC
ncbi:uncharacterized protein LOC127797334 isoform X2 [Diospyros lotus]|uniref:uncharacterized protein LOC127797334 isoform X2 n=1 Tax=Diospyros lotus TaxID=55363 RepID=UPI002251FA36|nr:uncharacterized protein LOC127797334 isoform X2 [Diospyros lotus]